MIGYIYIDKELASNKCLIDELLYSDAFRNSGYEIRMNISRSEYEQKLSNLAYDYDIADPIMVFASTMCSLAYEHKVHFDGDVDYSNIRKLKDNEDKKLNSIFFLPEDLGTSWEHGVAVIDPSTKNFIAKQPKNRPIKNEEQVAWSSLLSCCYWNSIIVVDCYLLKSKDSIQNNLFPILRRGISKSSKIQVSIFTQFKKFDHRSKEYQNLMWEGAPEFIKKEFPNISLEIIDVKNAPQEIHDRSILTNHYYYHVPGGLDLLNSKGQSTKHTKIIAYKFPQFYEVTKDDLDDFCEKIKSYREDPQEVIGSKKGFKNRLIY